MMPLRGLFLALAVLVALPLTARAAEDGLDAIDHTADGYYLDFAPFAKVQLPRIFLVRRADGSMGFDTFATTRAALLSQRYGVPAEAQDIPVVRLDEQVLLAPDYYPVYNIHPVEGRILIDFSITRHLLYAILACILAFLVFTTLARRYARGVGRDSAPRGVLQNLFEVLIVFVRDEIARPTIGEEKHRKFVPYLLTVFFFILFCNLFGLIPLGATATANITVTAVLAIFTFVVTQVNGSRDYWQHVFNPPGIPWWLLPIMIPVELLGMFTKPFALAVRLFANMTAGHVIILSLVGLIFLFTAHFGQTAGWGVAFISVPMTLFIYFLELLVAFIQAYVFTMLSALFIGMAAAEHHHEDIHVMHPLEVEPGTTPALVTAQGKEESITAGKISH